MPVRDPHPSPAETLFSPAKINLMLSVHGKREDGFHALTSLVVALDFGDSLTVEPVDTQDRLRCTDPTVPLGADNLVLRAAAVFREHLGEARYFAFDLEKRIPMGAGLGGGSSNAATALLGMNHICGGPFDGDALRRMAAELGSDCAFFVESRPALMRGRGERIDPLADELAAQLEGRKLLLCYPEFGVGTAWAYGRLVANAPKYYESEDAAGARLCRFEKDRRIGGLLFNSFEPAVGNKYRALLEFLSNLRDDGIDCLMSGSGSACFAWLPEEADLCATLRRRIRDAWGADAFCVETSVRAQNTPKIG